MTIPVYNALLGLVPAVLVAVLPACSPEVDHVIASTQRDSAGIHIIESHAPAWLNDGWLVSPLPAMQIGTMEGEPDYQLFQVLAVRKLSDGKIAVANAGTNEVRIYSSTGRIVRKIGREGAGPGEFRYPRNLWLGPLDTLIVADLDRVSVFDSAGHFQYARAFGLSGPRDRFLDGSYLWVTFAPGVNPIELGHSRPNYVVVRAGVDGANPDTLLQLAGDEVFRHSADGRIYNRPAPFGAQRLFAIHGRSVYTGDGSVFDVWELAHDGRAARIFRRPGTPKPVTPAAIRRYEDARLATARTDAQRTRWQQVFREWRYPAAQPFYDQLIVDKSGNAWVRHFRDRTDGPAQWTVFNSTGSWLGEVELPGSLQVREIGDDYILGLCQDGLGVEYVQLYTIDKKSSHGRNVAERTHDRSATSVPDCR